MDQQLEITSQLFPTMVNKYCRNGLRGNASYVTSEGISRQKFPMNYIMKSRWLRAILRENWVHRVIILNRGSMPRKKREESDANFPDLNLQRHSVTSFETASSLANGPSWG